MERVKHGLESNSATALYLLKLNSDCPTLVTLTLKLATFQAWNPGYHSIEASPQHPLWGVGVCGRVGGGVARTGGPLYLLKLHAKVVYTWTASQTVQNRLQVRYLRLIRQEA